MEYGNLYIVATPIGNLEDITYRAIRILQEVDIISAEDTRHTLKLLNHYNISKHLISYHRHNEEIKSEELINYLKQGKNIAIVSDAGTPGICDPGHIIIKKCIEQDIKIIPVPGACAFVNALICSGLDTDTFLFLGFLPLNKKNRKYKLEQIQNSTQTVILYEAPHKLQVTLKDLKDVIKDRKVVIARELTKIHEEFISGNIDEIIEKSKNLKGEIIILIEKEAQKTKEEKQKEFENFSLEEHYSYYEKQGFNKKEIIKKIAKDRNVTKNDIYKNFIKLKENTNE